MNPQTFVGLRRLSILKKMAASPKPSMTVTDLSGRLGLCAPTVRAHLQALEDLKLVTRFNYRRWSLAPGFTLGGLDGSRLDP